MLLAFQIRKNTKPKNPSKVIEKQLLTYFFNEAHYFRHGQLLIIEKKMYTKEPTGSLDIILVRVLDDKKYNL